MQRWIVLLGCLYCGLLAAQTVEPAVLHALQQAQAAQSRGEQQRGLQLLEALKLEKNSFAEALVLRNKAYLAWQAGQIQRAAHYLKQALQTGQLSAEERQEDGLNLGKLYIQLQQPARALAALKGQPQTDEVLQLSILAWQMQGRYDQALPLAERYLAGQKNISNDWLQFMVVGHVNLKQYAKAVQWQQRILKRDADNFAQWKQLAGLQHAAGDPGQAFATLRTAFSKGLEMKPQDLQQMLSMATAADQPWQGARLLQQLLANGKLKNDLQQQETLARLYWQARERGKAIELFRQLAERSGNAEHWLILAQLAMQQQDWSLSARALDSARQAGASRKQVQAWQDWLESSRQAEQVARDRMAAR